MGGSQARQAPKAGGRHFWLLTLQPGYYQSCCLGLAHDVLNVLFLTPRQALARPFSGHLGSACLKGHKPFQVISCIETSMPVVVACKAFPLSRPVNDVRIGDSSGRETKLPKS